MRLAELYMQGMQAVPKADYAAIAQATPGKTKGNDKFASYINQAERNSSAIQKTVDTANVRKNDYRKNTAKANPDTAGIGNQTELVIARQPESKEAPKADALKKSESAPKTEGAEAEFSEADFDAAGKEVLEKLAQALNIPLEAIQQALISLNIKPLELQDGAKVNELVQKLTGVESKAGLLNLPEVPEMISKISDVMSGFEEVAQEFINQMENAEMGRPKFVMAETSEPVAVAVNTVNAIPMKDTAQAIGPADENAEIPVEAQQTQVVNTPQKTADTANTANQAFQQGQNPGQNPETMPMAETIETAHDGVAPVQTTAANNIVFEKAMLKNESLKNVDTADVINQIVEKMKVEVKGDTSEIRITLRPEHLGDVTLKIATQNGIVTAQFMAENQKVKEILESGFQQLKQSLQDQGINVSQLSVSVGQENTGRQMEQFARAQERSSARINQIMQGIEAEEAGITAAAAVRENQIYDINVDYRA